MNCGGPGSGNWRGDERSVVGGDLASPETDGGFVEPVTMAEIASDELSRGPLRERRASEAFELGYPPFSRSGAGLLIGEVRCRERLVGLARHHYHDVA
jgi:hypothetical protein